MAELILTIHIIVASFWIGGMLFMALVLSPYVRKLSQSTQAFQAVGRRYSFWGTVIGLPILFITGMFNIKYISGLDPFRFWSVDAPYVHTLKIKLGLFFLTVILAVIHDFYFGERAHLSPTYKKISRVIGILNLIIGILIIYFAVRLRLGGC